MPRFEVVVRLIVVVSLLLPSFPALPSAASGLRQPHYQTVEPAPPPTTPPPAPATETPTARETPIPTSTLTPLATDTLIPASTETAPAPLTPTSTLPTSLTPLPATATITVTATLPPPPPASVTETTPPTETATAVPTPNPEPAEAIERQGSGFRYYLPLILKDYGLRATFSANPVLGPIPLTVTFVNSSTFTTDYVWDFGDGMTSTEVNPSHIYTQAGVYTVTLLATGGVFTDVLTKANFISPFKLSPADIQIEVSLGALSAFPSTPVLDSFNRSNGAMGSNWSGGTSGYSIVSNRLDVGSGDNNIYWNVTSFGADQEVYVTLTTVNTVGGEQDLLLKSQSGTAWEDGLIEVLYDAAGQRVQVWTYASAQDWVQRGADIPVTFANGDQFGAKATAGGQVEVYKNGTLLATRSVTAWPYYANGGYIGLWFISAGNAVLDDFGGGTVSTVPTPIFSASPVSGTVPLTVTFTNSSTGASSYLWQFGDNTSSTAISPTHTYTQAGVYTVTLFASTGSLTTPLTRTNYITVSTPSPVPNFSGNPLTGTVPLTVTFMNSSTGASSYLWEFGDNTSGTAISPTHTYTQAGVYTVTLFASSGTLTNPLTRTNYITVISPSIPSAFPSTNVLDNFNRSNGAIGSSWSGTTSGYSIVSNRMDVESAQAIFWNPTSFGTSQEVYITLTTVDSGAGEQDLLLKVQNISNWSDGLIEVLYDAVGQRVQVWTYTAAQDWVQRGADIPVTFASGDQFGARATASGQVEVYRNGALLASRDVTAWPYYANGGYIGLWFVDASNAVLDDFGGGTVSAVPTPIFSASPLTGTVPLTVTFTNSSTDASSYLWQFGDNTSSTAISPTHTYTQAGVYTVTLFASAGTVTTPLTRANYITISTPSPVLDFSATPVSGTVPLTVTFTNSSTGASSYLWKFGDNTTSTAISPIHTYTQAGVYTVTLSAGGGTYPLTRTNYITVTASITREWQQITSTGTSPSVSGEHVMAYDSNRNRIVLYGGNGSGWPYENTTWEFNGTDWITTTSTSPDARYGTAMAYDSVSQTMILFGGSNADDVSLNQTWQYTNTNWVQVFPATSPLSRTYASMVAGPDGQLYLFGGNDGEVYFHDLWRYENGTWTDLTPAMGPVSRTLGSFDISS
ncbi:MAG: PKD domain-containing protein [Anaerolineae bacterium]|nr:PKD domain-containing protein [Anaerolineae bacterium]